MKRLRRRYLRFTGLFNRDRREQDLAAEIESHLQHHIDDNLRSGMTEPQARREAILKLGGIESTKQAFRETRTVPFLENLAYDTRFAIRQLRKNPGFACTAVLTLALGLCASITMFSFLDAVLLRPLPYPNADRLVLVTERTPQFPLGNLSYYDYLDWKQRDRVFTSLDVLNPTGYLLNTPSITESVPAVRVSDGFFRTLGIKPFLGRDFFAGEDLPSASRTVILSYSIWHRRFNGSKAVLGQTVRLSGVPHTIVGVLPESFQFAPRGSAELWTPLHAAGACETRRSCHNLYGIARLKDGVSISVALAGMQAIARALEKEYPGSNRDQGASVLPLSQIVFGPMRPILLLLFAGGLLLFSIACVNVASLLLARAEARRREIGVRSSLGASSLRLITQLITESAILIIASNLIALVLATWLMRISIHLIPAIMLANAPFLVGLHPNGHILGFAAMAGLGSIVLFSVVPALHLHLSGVRAGLNEGSRGSAGRGWRRLGSHLVVVELTLAMVLLVGAGLLAKSLSRLLDVNIGFDAENLATVNVALPDVNYSKHEQMIAFEHNLLKRILALPGVQATGAVTNNLPISGNGNTDWIRFVGKPFHGEHNEVNERDISSGYFQTIHARLLRGRFFTDADDASRPRVAIINRTAAEKYYPGEDPIGRRFGDGDLSPASLRQIVGIVDDIREGSLDSEIWPAEYLPFDQAPDTYFSVVAKTSHRPESLLPSIAAAVHKLDPGVGTIGESSMIQLINDSPSTYLHRSSAWLVGSFAIAALLLGGIGVYGVIAYSVTQRTREIGIRMALGAERLAVHRLILKEAQWLTVRGLIAGLVCSLALASLMRNLLFGVKSWDLETLIAVALVLACAALLATYIPARRAAGVDPIQALRTE